MAPSSEHQDQLPPGLSRGLAAFERHVAAERGMSPHTVRAYRADVTSLLRHAGQDGCTELADIDIRVLRAWLATQHGAGQARASIARRAAAARAFTAFGLARGWLASDPGRLLGTPKTGRHLPQVLGQDQMAAVLAVQGTRRGSTGPASTRPGSVGPGGVGSGGVDPGGVGSGGVDPGGVDPAPSPAEQALILRDTA